MNRTGEIFLSTLFIFVLGFFCHTVYTGHFEKTILAPKGKLRYEIKKALEKTKKVILNLNLDQPIDQIER